MIAGANLRHLEGAELNVVEIVRSLGECVTIMDLDREVAAGFLLDVLGKRLNTGGECPRRSPDRKIPRNLRVILGVRRKQCGDTKHHSKRKLTRLRHRRSSRKSLYFFIGQDCANQSI